MNNGYLGEKVQLDVTSPFPTTVLLGVAAIFVLVIVIVVFKPELLKNLLSFEQKVKETAIPNEQSEDDDEEE